MASSLFSQPPQQQDINQVKFQLMNSSNPMATIQMMAASGDPRAQFALSNLQNGSSPRQAVLNILKQRGIPVQAFMNNPLFK